MEKYIGEKGYLFPNSAFGYDDKEERNEEMIRRIYRKVNEEIQKRAMETLGKKLSTHWFRHSRIILLLEEGYDLRTIQKFTGHSSLNTLEWYLRQAGIDSKNIAIEERERGIIEW